MLAGPLLKTTVIYDDRCCEVPPTAWRRHLIRSLLKRKPADHTPARLIHKALQDEYKRKVPSIFFFLRQKLLFLLLLIFDTPSWDSSCLIPLRHCFTCITSLKSCGLIDFILLIMCLQWHTMRSISQQHIMDLTCLSSSLEKLLWDIIECSIYVKQSLLTWKTKFIVTIYLMMCSLSLETDEVVPADRLFHFLPLKVVFLWFFEYILPTWLSYPLRC